MALPSAFDRTLFDCAPAADGSPWRGYEAPFAIVTAWETTGERWGAEANLLADLRLQQRLSALGLAHHRVTGWAPLPGGGLHAEPGWAVVCSRPQAVELGIAFRQRAVFWIEEGVLWLVSCASAEEDRPLQTGFRDRLRPRPLS